MRRSAVPLVATQSALSRVKQRVVRSAFVGHLQMYISIKVMRAVLPMALYLGNAKSVRLAFWMLLAVTRPEHMIVLLDSEIMRPDGPPPRSSGVVHAWVWPALLTVMRVSQIGVRAGPKQNASGAADMPSAVALPLPHSHPSLTTARPAFSIG